MRWIYISPHFDDAVLSCGGLIWEQTHSGIPVEIWTVMAGDPPPGPPSELINRIHAEWQTGSPQETVSLRRSEDQKAARRVGASIRHLSFPDAIYRRSEAGELFYPEDIFVSPNPAETGLGESIARSIAEKLTQYDTIVCPLTIGGHVDHVLTRHAVELLGRPLWYYADIPYTLNHAEELFPVTGTLQSEHFFISQRGLAAWQASIAAHASQISSLFVDVEDMRQKIKEYARTNSGLLLWERAVAL